MLVLPFRDLVLLRVAARGGGCVRVDWWRGVVVCSPCFPYCLLYFSCSYILLCYCTVQNCWRSVVDVQSATVFFFDFVLRVGLPVGFI